MTHSRYRIILCVLVSGIQLLHASLLVAAPEGILQQAFFNPTPQDSDDFGESVATQGNHVFVGARFDNTGASDAGAAYMFDQSGNLLQTFLNPTPASSDQFGSAVLPVGSNILIGAIRDDTAGADAGAAYLFSQSGGSVLQTYLNPTPGADEFGFSLAATSDGKVAISAYRDDSNGPQNSGAVYVFNQSGALLQTILNPTPGGDEFGRALTAVGDKLLIGARNDDTSAQNAGIAYLYDTSGNLLQTFLNPTPAVDDNFGWSVGSVGNNVLIGAFLDDTGAENAGAAYLFDQSGNLLKTFLNPDPDFDDEFGFAVAGAGDKALISAYLDDTKAFDAGAAYLFDTTSGNLLGEYYSPTPANSDHFGFGVAAVGNDPLIGAPLDPTNAPDTGAVYLFNAIPEPSTLLLAALGLLGLTACPRNKNRSW